MQRRWSRKCITAAGMTNGFCSLFATTTASVWNPQWFSYFSFYHVGWCSCRCASCCSAGWSCTTHSWTRPDASLTRSKGRAEAAAERIDQRDSQGGRCHSNSHSCGRDEPWACQQMHVNKRRPCDCMRACQYLSCQVRRRSRLMKKAQGLTTGDLAWLIARRAAEWGYSIHASEKDAVELQQVSSSFSSKAEGELCIRRRRWGQDRSLLPFGKSRLLGHQSDSLESQGAGWVDGFSFGLSFVSSRGAFFVNPNFMCRNHFGCFHER